MALTDDQQLKDQGKLDQAVGDVKLTLEHAVDKANAAMNGSDKK